MFEVLKGCTLHKTLYFLGIILEETCDYVVVEYSLFIVCLC
jgi:hypothetical protein